MRERQRHDWDVDLAQRHGLESTVQRALERHAAVAHVRAATSSMTELDYRVVLRSGIDVRIELKTKRQHYSTWWHREAQRLGPDAALVIVDELTVRRLVDAAPHAYVLIADLSGPCAQWFVFSLGDLLVADRVRVARPLASPGVVKGKFLYDLRDAPVAADDLDEAIDGLDLLTRTVQVCWHHIAPWPATAARKVA